MLVMTVIPAVTFAQRGIPRSNNISVGVKRVTETKLEREYQKYDAKVGFQQFVELTDFEDFDNGMTGVNYIAGYRFNNWIFAGVGTGLDFSHRVNSGVLEYVGGSVSGYLRDDDYYGSFLLSQLDENIIIEGYQSYINPVYLPLYAHVRGYYTRTRWAPYSAFSVGGIFSSKEVSPYLDISTGVDVRLSKDPNKESKHLYFALGFWYRSIIDKKDCFYLYDSNVSYTSYALYENCHDSSCPIQVNTNRYDDHLHVQVSDVFGGKKSNFGISFRVGLSF